MNVQRKFIIAPTIALVLTLGGCGGGGSGVGLASTPPPISGPTPTPTPPPSQYSGPVALQSPQPFATAGYAARHSVNVDGTNPVLLTGPASSDTISFRQMPGTSLYQLALPRYQGGILFPTHYNGTVCSNGTVCQPSSITHRVGIGNTNMLQDVDVNIPVPGSNYPDPTLTYTSLASWYGSSRDPADATRDLREEGVFAYGIPTAPGDVPTSGSGTYAAVVEGRTDQLGNYIGGSASLTFDFALGTLSGEMRPLISDGWDLQPLGVYAFTQTVFGIGNTTFSGLFDGPVSGGEFEGRFTGPQAAELLARWQAPYLNPINQTTGTMFGVWVGKRK